MLKCNKATKISIIGAGNVGSATAFNLASHSICDTLVLADINAKRADAEALDITHGSLFYGDTKIIGTDDYALCHDSDIIIITAGARQNGLKSRLDLLESTAEILKSIIPKLLKVSPDAIFLLVSNPVDIATYITLKLTGLPSSRVFGSGTLLDTSRLRTQIAKYLGVNVANIHAYIVGEHGDSEIPLWSSAKVAATSLLSWEPLPGHKKLTEDVREQIHRDTVQAAYQVIEGKGATNYAIALSTTSIVEAILSDSNRVLPLSVKLDGFLGLDDVCLSLPIRTGCQGVLLPPSNIAMSQAEEQAFIKSALAMRELCRKF